MRNSRILHYLLSSCFLKLKHNEATKDISHDSGIVNFIGFIMSLVAPNFFAVFYFGY